MKYKQLKYMRLRTGREHQWFEGFYNDNYVAVDFGLEDDLKLNRALSINSNIEFYKYKVNFKLYK